jgi:hypothetical protein
MLKGELDSHDVQTSSELIWLAHAQHVHASIGINLEPPKR